tara:strand:+ start:224 stop:421 length:198 start_codon:yes stop_codon:yes gene_type:complete
MQMWKERNIMSNFYSKKEIDDACKEEIYSWDGHTLFEYAYSNLVDYYLHDADQKTLHNFMKGVRY